MTPRVAIRVDASGVIGIGHLKRCLSLAQALMDAGAEVRFVCRELDDVAAKVLRHTCMHTQWLPAPIANFTPGPNAPPHAAWASVSQKQDAHETSQALRDWAPDWVVVDHYGFDAEWHTMARTALACRLMVIDDTADRAIDTDVLLDHNWAANHRVKYAGLLRREPVLLCGPRFALLSPAYRQTPRHVLHDTVRSIGVFMGGTDPDGVSAHVLAACREAGFAGPIEVVSTSSNPHLSRLTQACADDGHATLTLDAPDLTAFFARHDLQVGAGGGATWERCCVGAPSILVALAANQLPVLHAIEALGLAVRSGVSREALSYSIRHMLHHKGLRLRIHLAALQQVDGQGADRVAHHLLQGV